MDAVAIEDRIREVMLRETELPENVADDVAVHMTDCLDDLARFAEFCANPDKWKDEDIEEVLLAFLVHVPNHVAAAAKLLTGLPVTDMFGVGAVEDGSDNGKQHHQRERAKATLRSGFGEGEITSNRMQLGE